MSAFKKYLGISTFVYTLSLGIVYYAFDFSVFNYLETKIEYTKKVIHQMDSPDLKDTKKVISSNTKNKTITKKKKLKKAHVKTKPLLNHPEVSKNSKNVEEKLVFNEVIPSITEPPQVRTNPFIIEHELLTEETSSTKPASSLDEELSEIDQIILEQEQKVEFLQEEENMDSMTSELEYKNFPIVEMDTVKVPDVSEVVQSQIEQVSRTPTEIQPSKPPSNKVFRSPF